MLKHKNMSTLISMHVQSDIKNLMEKNQSSLTVVNFRESKI